MKKALKTEVICAVGDDGVGAMQDVEQQRLEKFRVLAHALEVEALEPRKRDGVLGVVEEKSELAAAGPFGEARRKAMAESVRENAERAQRRVHRIEIFDLVEELALGGGIEFAGPLIPAAGPSGRARGNRDFPWSARARTD